MKKIDLTPNYINNLNYTAFVAFSHQWNVLPGAFVTLNKWALYSRLTSKSRLLDVACTTGFKSRELARLTGCEAFGIDISESSIEVAKQNIELYAPVLRCSQ